jgi:hypothetical protein
VGFFSTEGVDFKIDYFPYLLPSFLKTDVLGEQPVSQKTDILAPSPPNAPPRYLDIFATLF